MSAHEVSHVHTSPYSTVEQSTCYKINQVKVPRHFEKKKKKFFQLNYQKILYGKGKFKQGVKQAKCVYDKVCL